LLVAPASRELGEVGGDVVPSWTGVRATVVDPIEAGEAIDRLEM